MEDKFSTHIPDRLDLGCGNNKKEGYYGVDISDTKDVDQVIDLDQPDWELPSDYFEHIRVIDVFEHIEDPVAFMEELYRISRPGAEIEIRAPHFSSQNWHDPTHKRLTGSRTFDNFTDRGRFQFYSAARFEIVSVQITFEWSGKLVQKCGSYIANKYMDFYEKSFLRHMLPATNITFKLKTVKSKRCPLFNYCFSYDYICKY